MRIILFILLLSPLLAEARPKSKLLSETDFPMLEKRYEKLLSEKKLATEKNFIFTAL